MRRGGKGYRQKSRNIVFWRGNFVISKCSKISRLGGERRLLGKKRGRSGKIGGRMRCRSFREKTPLLEGKEIWGKIRKRDIQLSRKSRCKSQEDAPRRAEGKRRVLYKGKTSISLLVAQRGKRLALFSDSCKIKEIYLKLKKKGPHKETSPLAMFHIGGS